MKRALGVAYGLLSYAIGLASIVYSVGFVTGLIVPKTIDSGEVTPLGEAIAVDTLLIALFAAQHSIMARAGFKAWWARIVPRPIERSTYVLFSGLVLSALLWQWRPITTMVWTIGDPVAANAMTALSLAGWSLVVASTFFINHFELFGLQQVVTNLFGTDMPAPRFRTPLLYKLVRHPLYLGLLIAFWATPVMTAGHLLFAVLNTVYILGGIMLEERDLTATFGDDYRAYRARVPMLLPFGTGGTAKAQPPRTQGAEGGLN